jgi:hypothetical protein
MLALAMGIATVRVLYLVPHHLSSLLLVALVLVVLVIGVATVGVLDLVPHCPSSLLVIVPHSCCPWSSPIAFIPAHHCPLSLSAGHHCHWLLLLAPAKSPASCFIHHGHCPVVVLVVVVPHHCCSPPVVDGCASLSAPPSPLQAVACRLGGGAVSGYQSVVQRLDVVIIERKNLKNENENVISVEQM